MLAAYLDVLSKWLLGPWTMQRNSINFKHIYRIVVRKPKRKKSSGR
jgi:hypothetical protein